MVAAKAILTARGGMTSHAAVVARGMGKPCVAGAQELEVDERAARVLGQRPTDQRGRLDHGRWQHRQGLRAARRRWWRRSCRGNFTRLMQWADKIRHLRVRVNADTPADAHRGRDFGAEGIGLCRTEHMFFEGDRLTAMREMIVAQDERGPEEGAGQAAADAARRFRGDLPRDGRLPGHHPAARSAAARVPAQGAGRDRGAGRASSGKPVEELQRIIDRLHEVNPMLGLRGCRLGIIYPEITAMQARAIFEAACTVAARKGRVHARGDDPARRPAWSSSGSRRSSCGRSPRRCSASGRSRCPILLGTMIELPRAALTADEIAREAQFFSFGTNDLTQTTWGLSRDDAGRFLPVLPRARDHRGRSLPGARPGRRRQADPDGLRAGTQDTAGPQARNLRRARR